MNVRADNDTDTRTPVHIVLVDLIRYRDRLMAEHMVMMDRIDATHINAQNTNGPLTQTQINQIFQQSDIKETEINNEMSKIEKIERLISYIQEYMEDKILPQIDTVAKELNNWNLSYGLQGALKHKINDMAKKDGSILDSMTEEVLDVFNAPYTKAPYPKKGGKKRRNKTTRKYVR